MSANDWLLLQLADSAFPAGGFAHSQGLEALYQEGFVRDETALEPWLASSCWQCAHGFLPVVTAAHAAPAAARDVDAVCDAFLSSHVANRASRQQGRALLSTAVAAFPSELLTALASDLRGGRAGHLAVVLGVVCRALELDSDHARRVALAWNVRGGLSAAVRLGIVGPVAAQRLQRALAPLLDTVCHVAAALGLDDIALTAPLTELAQMRHDQMYSRLFQS